MEPVAEVCVIGSADLSYWQQRLAAEGLSPAAGEGRAWITVCATEATFGRRTFREGTLAVATTEVPGSEESDGALLFSAFNSIPLYAWVERTRNKSPYHKADIALSLDGPRSALSFTLSDGVALTARMGGDAGEAPPAEDSWEGDIYLPSGGPDRRGAGPYFHGLLEGPATSYPFGPTDALTFGPGAAGSPVAELEASHFTPTEWRVRPAGRHAKTKTLSGPRAVLALDPE